MNTYLPTPLLEVNGFVQTALIRYSQTSHEHYPIHLYLIDDDENLNEINWDEVYYIWNKTIRS